MYLSFYNLKQRPFQITTNPRFLWLGEKHREALATLKYGILADKGFLLLTGDVGTGKTTLINALLKILDSSIMIATVPDPGLELMDFLNFVGQILGMDREFAHKSTFLLNFTRHLNMLHAKGRKVLLVIDEAQRLNQQLLEEIRMLSNIERDDAKLINIFFIGQPEFNKMLLKEENRAIRQRITVNYHIQNLTESETGHYIRHRLQVAGAKRDLFQAEAIAAVYKFSSGYPRLINVICDRALLNGFVEEATIISPVIIKECTEALRIPHEKRKITEKKEEDQDARRAEKTEDDEQESSLAATDTETELPSLPEEGEDSPPPYSEASAITGSEDNQPAGGELKVRISIPEEKEVVAADFAETATLILNQANEQGGHTGKTSANARIKRPVGLVWKRNGIWGMGAILLLSLVYFSRDYLLEKNFFTGNDPHVLSFSKGFETEAGLSSENSSEKGADFSSSASSLQQQEVADNPVTSTGETVSAQTSTESDDSSARPDSDDVLPASLKPNAVADNVTSKATETEADAQSNEVAKPQEDQKTDTADTSAAAPFLAKVVVNFDNESNNLSEETIYYLNRFVEGINYKPDAVIIVRGYTSNIGSQHFNNKLSKKRAEIVKTFLVGKGIPPGRITTAAMGDADPVASNETLEGRNVNRRVEVEMVDISADSPSTSPE